MYSWCLSNRKKVERVCFGCLFNRKRWNECVVGACLIEKGGTRCCWCLSNRKRWNECVVGACLIEKGGTSVLLVLV